MMLPPILEWIEKGFEKLHQKVSKFKKRVVEKSKERKRILEKVERDEADITVASYLMKKRETKQQRLRELRARKKDRNQEQERSV